MSDATNAAHEIGAFLRDQGSGEVMWPMPSTAKGSDPVSSLDERDTGHAFFSLLALRNSGGHAALLAAARPLARKIFLSGEPGRDINPRLIERLLSRPIDQVRFMENKKIFQDVQAGMTPYHVTVELVAMLIALAERDTIRTECEALRAAADAAGGYDKLYILFPDPAPLHELIEGPPRAPLPPYRELRVLVTGATSVTGAAIVKHLVALGVTVTAAASKTDSGATNGACLGSSLGAHRFVETDLFLSGGVAEELCKDVHAVVHTEELASPWPVCGTLLSARVPAATSKAHKVNVTSTAALLLAARKSSSVQRFVFLSTSELYYTGTGEGAIRMKEWYHKPSRAFLAESRPKDMAARGEWSALPMARQQGTAYAATKLRAEYLVQKAHLDGLSTVVLRPAPVLSGIGDADEVRAEDAPPLDERLLPLLSARRLLSLLAHRKLPLVGDGSACADVTHADNVAHAVALALRAKHETVSGRTYNVSADEPVRIVPLLQQLCERLTLPPPSAARSATSAWLRALLREAAAVAFRFVVRAPYESPTAAPSLRSLDVACLARHRLIDAAAAKRDLGYSPLVSTQEAVRRFADDVQRTMPPEMRQQFKAQLEAAKLKALGEEGLAKAKEVEKSKPPPPPPRTAAFDPAAGAPPPSAVSALREWAQRAPDRPALLFTRIALPSTLRRRVTLVTYLSLLLLCVVLEVIFAAREHAHRHELQRVASQPAEWDEAEDGRWEPHREPRPFGYRTLFRRATFTGVSDKLLLVLLALLLRLYFHPHRTPNHLRLLKTTWHALSYMQLASIVASMAHGLRKAGVQRGSTVFVLYESPTKAHAFALTLALQAVGATVIEGEPLTLGWRAYCKAVADARPDFVLSSRRVRLLLALLRPLSLLRLLPCAVPSGYRWARAAGLLTRSASGAIYLNNDELAEALPDPDDDAVAALRLGANDRAVWHDLAYGACAALHPMGAHDPAANMEPALLHSMVNRLGATVLSAPPAVWRRLVAMLPAGALRSVCLPLTSGAYLPPHVFVSSNALMPAAKPPASSSCASSFASSFGLLAVYSSPEGLPFAACTSSDVLGGAAGIVGGKGVCVGRPLASGAAPGVSPGVYLDREVWATPGAPEAPRTHLANHKLMEAGSASPYAAVGAKPDPADVYGEIVISRPPAQGTPSRAAPAIAEVRTGEVGSIDATGRLWLHGRISELVRTASMGTVPALDVESVVGATGLVRWAALVSAPLSSSASAAVLVVSLALTHPITGAPLKWGAEVRCDLREALKRSRWLPLSGSLRLLEFKGATPTDSATSSRLDRPLLRRWAAEALRGIGPEALKLDDRNDSLAMLKRNKVM